MKRKIQGYEGTIFLDEFAFIRANSAATESVALLLAAAALPLPTEANQPLPTEFVWMPAGEHEITAHDGSGQGWTGKVICDEQGFRSVQATLERLHAAGHRVPLDQDHKDEGATAWVLAFRWDPAQGIVVKVEWTALGEQLLRGKVYHSFSPAFLLNRKTARVSGFPGGGHAAGGLVNAPAFGTAMPSLIAARLAAVSPTKTASDGPSDNQKKVMKELLIKILAALAVSHAADATEEQLIELAGKHIDRLPEAGAEGKMLKAQLSELQTLRAKAAEVDALKAKDLERRKADAKREVDQAVARGALPAKDEAIQAKWAGLIEADPKNVELLAAMPGNPALARVTEPGSVVISRDNLLPVLQALHAKNLAANQERGSIYVREIAPIFAKNPDFGRELMQVLAVNSLGTLSGELITQRSLSLLKLSFPWLTKISTDFSPEAVSFGQTVKTRLKTIPGTVSFVPGTGYVRAGATTTDVPVVINAHKGVEIAFNANELSSTNRDLFGEQVEGAHYALGKDFADAILALITVANFANESIEATNNVDADTMDTLDAELAARGVAGPRIGLLSSAVFRKLGKDSSIVNLAAFQMKEIITQSQLPPIKNIQPFEVHNLPAPVGENLTGFAGSADALAFATRTPNDYTKIMPDVGSNGVVQIVTNPDTGISVMLVRYVDHKLAEAAWRIAVQFGAAKGNGAAGQRLISAARA